jgi:hypothetical protein
MFAIYSYKNNGHDFTIFMFLKQHTLCHEVSKWDIETSEQGDAQYLL